MVFLASLREIAVDVDASTGCGAADFLDGLEHDTSNSPRTTQIKQSDAVYCQPNHTE